MPRNTPAYEGEKKDFPSILRKLMEKDYKDKHGKKDSQEALAKEIGVQRQTVSGYLNGLSSPDWEKIVKIAKRYDVSADYLLGLSHDPDRTPSAVDELGLSPAAVKHILDIKQYADSESDPDGDFHKNLSVLDRFLSSRRFSRFLAFFMLAEKAAEQTKAANKPFEETDKNRLPKEVFSYADRNSYAVQKYLCLKQFEKMLDEFCDAEGLDD